MPSLPPYAGYALSALDLKTLPASTELKKVWRLLVKENHPDLFPEAFKKAQEEKIQEINAAYRALGSFLKTVPKKISPKTSENAGSKETKKKTISQKTAKASLRGDETVLHGDPVYAWYKRGFRLYSEAVGGIHAKWMRSKAFRGKALELFLKRLHLLWEARDYFQRVVREEPGSVWVRDASYKLWRIEQFTRVYTRIKENLAARREKIKTQ